MDMNVYRKLKILSGLNHSEKDEKRSKMMSTLDRSSPQKRTQTVKTVNSQSIRAAVEFT